VTAYAVISAVLLIPTILTVILTFKMLKIVSHSQPEHWRTLSQRQRRFTLIVLVAWLPAVALGFGVGYVIARNLWGGVAGVFVMSMAEPILTRIIAARSGELKRMLQDS